MADADGQAWMRSRWDALAKENAEFFIWTGVAKGDDFFASGERDVTAILVHVDALLPKRGQALEIGCGIGRLTLPMSRHFASVTAVDIAPTMLTKLDENCRRAGVTNVRGVLSDGAWDTEPVDFAYSRIVFQHIADWNVIADYFRRVRACLAPGGLFYAHFDTRPSNVAYRVRNLLPDFILPRTWIRGVRRIRRTPGEIGELARQAGLELTRISGEGTADTVLLFKRAPGNL